MASYHKYYFGRVDMFSALGDKKGLINKALNSSDIEFVGQYKYGFFEPKKIWIDEEEFVAGYLVKFKPILEKEVVDESRHEVIDREISDGVIAKSRFYLHCKTMVFSYRPIVGKISAQQFRKIFSHLVESLCGDLLAKCYVESIDEETKILDAINKFDLLERISVEVHPTNPNNRHIYKDVDTRIKGLEAQSFRQEIIGGTNGLNKNNVLSDDIYNSLVMAVDGYGEGVVVGKVDGEKKTIHTYDSPVNCDVDSAQDDSLVLLILNKAFKRIWNRKNEAP